VKDRERERERERERDREREREGGREGGQRIRKKGGKNETAKVEKVVSRATLMRRRVVFPVMIRTKRGAGGGGMKGRGKRRWEGIARSQHVSGRSGNRESCNIGQAAEGREGRSKIKQREK